QSVTVQVPAGANAHDVRRALQAVLDHHDMLRARLLRDGGAWRLEVPEPRAVDAGGLLARVDVPPDAGAAADLAALIAEHEALAVARLDPDAGVMLQAVFLDRTTATGQPAPGRLVLAAHHVVVDGVSWRILIEDLATAWTQIHAGDSIELAAVPTSFRTWAQALERAGRDRARAAEQPLWEATAIRPAGRFATRPLDPQRDTAATIRERTITLESACTASLLGRAPAALGVTINDILLGGLGAAAAEWRRRSGRPAGSGTLVALEGHGREEHVAGADLSRTIGWFTSTFPVHLDVATDIWPGVEAGEREVVEPLVAGVGAALCAIADGGLGYGILRYLDPAARDALAVAAQPELQFNYLGRYIAQQGGDWRTPADLSPLNGGRGADMPAGYPLVLDAMAVDVDGLPELRASWEWAAAVLQEDDVMALGELWFVALRGIVRAAPPRRSQ
ncbi:MAG: hypothetical protein QOG56_1295, partial [Solirubrobacteraceae bacterium]|nr:hypothetical protein [Solirubrobacteraceae bacterium]